MSISRGIYPKPSARSWGAGMEVTRKSSETWGRAEERSCPPRDPLWISFGNLQKVVGGLVWLKSLGTVYRKHNISLSQVFRSERSMSGGFLCCGSVQN